MFFFDGGFKEGSVVDSVSSIIFCKRFNLVSIIRNKFMFVRFFELEFNWDN